MQSGPLCAHYGGGKSIVLQSLVAAERIVFGKLSLYEICVFKSLERKKSEIETKTSAKTLSFLFCSLFQNYFNNI